MAAMEDRIKSEQTMLRITKYGLQRLFAGVR